MAGTDSGPFNLWGSAALSRREKDFLRKLKVASEVGNLDHQNLLNNQGGTSGEYYHFTQSQHAALLGTSGITVTSVTNTITAGATQTQAGATVLSSEINRVTVSGTNGDGVKLPTAVGGQRILIINDDSAETIQIWPNTSDTIDGESANAVDPNTLAAGASREYIDVDATKWYTV